MTTPHDPEPIKDPGRLDWHEVVKVRHYWLEVDAMTRPMRVEQGRAGYQSERDENA